MIEHLSYSSITTYLACAAAWDYKYNQQLRTWSTPELAFGTAFHKTVEQFIQTPGGNLVALWQEHAPEAFAAADIQWGTDTPEQFINDGIRILSDGAVQYNLATIKPLEEIRGPAIEKRVELRVPGVPVPVIGYIDVITQDGVPADFKTSSKSWTTERARSETQSLFYLAALNQAGINNHNWTFRHYILTKLKSPRLDTFEHGHKPGEVFWLFGMIRKVWQGIQANVYPENPGSWKCSPAYCDFWTSCRGKV